MGELVVPQFDLEFYRPGCLRIPEGTPEYETALRGTTSYLNRHYLEQIVAVQELEVEKPKWFQEAETDARRFIDTLAFDSTTQVVMFAHDDENRVFGKSAPVSAIAIHEPYAIIVKREAINYLRHHYGQLGVGKALVHELAHATAPADTRMGVHVLGSRKLEFVYGAGWMIGAENHTRGAFIEEGFAEYISGYYVRCRDNGRRPTPLISFTDMPPPGLPPHYAFTISPEQVSGPDGYSIELLAWGMQKEGIIPVNDFVAMLLESRRPETATAARREFIHAMEALSPGLYAYLRDLPYSRANWQAACAQIHAFVTRA